MSIIKFLYKKLIFVTLKPVFKTSNSPLNRLLGVI